MSIKASVAVTDYKKVVPVAPKKHLSARKNTERAMIINLIVDGLMPKKGRALWKSENSSFIGSLTATPNISYLRKILELVPYATHAADVRFIIAEASEYHRRDFDSLHANRQFLHDGMRMEELRRATRDLHPLGYDSNDFVPTLQAHLVAEKCFNETFDWSALSLDDVLFPELGSYYVSSGICQVVEDHHSELGAITDVMTSHGVTHAAGLRHVLDGRAVVLAEGAI